MECQVGEDPDHDYAVRVSDNADDIALALSIAPLCHTSE